MIFYDILLEHNALEILDYVPYSRLTFKNTEKINDCFRDIIVNNRKVFIYGDYDIDGLCSAIICYEALIECGCDSSNVDIYNYKKRTHKLDKLAVMECIQRMPDYFIICDTGSSEIEKISTILKYGIKVIVMDHHNTIYSYEDYEEHFKKFQFKPVVINTTIENALYREQSNDKESTVSEKEGTVSDKTVSQTDKGAQLNGNSTQTNEVNDKFKLSAGALVFCVMDSFAALMNVNIIKLSAYALISLYSDCMDMSNRINRSLYYLAETIAKDDLPPKIRIFMHEKSCFFSRFIQFKFAPVINASFRSEKFEYINTIFFDRNADAASIARNIEAMQIIYKNIREMVLAVSDAIEYKELNNFVFADLRSVEPYIMVDDNKLFNYTGLIANKLSEKCEKPAIIVCRMNKYYKGSFRDIKGKNYLQIFKQFSKAEGHNPAFGIKIPIFEFEYFLKTLRNLDEKFAVEKVNNSPIIIDYNKLMPDLTLLNEISLYNEFAGQSLPEIYLKKVFTANISGGKTKYYFLYRWGDCIIQSNHGLSIGNTILLKPFRTSNVRALVV